MRRAANEIDLAVTQRAIGLVDREDQFERDVETEPFEHSEFDGGRGRKIRIRDQVWNGELHGLSCGLKCTEKVASEILDVVAHRTFGGKRIVRMDGIENRAMLGVDPRVMALRSQRQNPEAQGLVVQPPEDVGK